MPTKKIKVDDNKQIEIHSSKDKVYIKVDKGISPKTFNKIIKAEKR